MRGTADRACAMARNSSDTAEENNAAWRSARWISYGLLARSIW